MCWAYSLSALRGHPHARVFCRLRPGLAWVGLPLLKHCVLARAPCLRHVALGEVDRPKSSAMAAARIVRRRVAADEAVPTEYASSEGVKYHAACEPVLLHHRLCSEDAPVVDSTWGFSLRAVLGGVKFDAPHAEIDLIVAD